MSQPEPFDVHRFQAWMLTVVSHPDGVVAGLDAAREHYDVDAETVASISPGAAGRSPVQRLEVYADMYFLRLVDILADDYAAMVHALGWDDFDALARAYLVDHRPAKRTLSGLGHLLPAFMADRELADKAFMLELARYETEKEALFFGERRVETLDSAALGEIPPELWADSRLETIPGLVLLAHQFPIHAFCQAVYSDDAPEQIPDAEPSWAAIWRCDADVWRAPLTREQHTILTQLQAGSTLGDAIEACAELPDFNPEALMGALGSWFAEWTQDGLFTAVHFPE